MNIELSGKKKVVADGITVAELIVQEQLETPKHVKVAVNDDFVEVDAFEKTVLQEGDVVEFLIFMGGGCR
ncbi:sulfur carrier protein ThiS [Eubacterium sp. MSJ-21]|jgi:sulfur carrier protein|nr:sulfur carrier protein ThiS [Eubacterium sp. MSJ-21]